MGKFEVQNQILDRVFSGKLKTAPAIIALWDNGGVTMDEARRLVMEAAHNGKAHRKAAAEKGACYA